MPPVSLLSYENPSLLSQPELLIFAQSPIILLLEPSLCGTCTFCVEQFTIKRMELFSEKNLSTLIQHMTTSDHFSWASFQSNRSISRLPIKFWNIIYFLRFQVLYCRLNCKKKPYNLNIIKQLHLRKAFSNHHRIACRNTE